VGGRHARHVAEIMTGALSRDQLDQLLDLCHALAAVQSPIESRRA
jgi:hypothetical protein